MAGQPLGRILIVDDEPLIREMAREILEAEGFAVEEAHDGLAGLDRIQQGQAPFDLVVLDLVMPRMHGFQVMDRIQELAPGTPILLSSGYSPEARPDLLRPTSTTGFLSKPYRSRDLVASVKRLLAAKAAS